MADFLQPDDVDDGPSGDSDIPSFSGATFDPSQQQYGLTWLLRKRKAMMPIPKPDELRTLKFLICADGYAGQDDEPPERDRGKGREGKGKGKGKDGKSKDARAGGRFIPDLGKTEIMTGSQRGNWWRNCSPDNMDVIVREQFLLTSSELCKVPYGQYVLQAGPLEVFVSGPASGLQRMPVQPRGWATVDATSVGGPLYLEKVRSPRWKVVFSSGSSKGDIVVRHGVSLDSDEVAVLTCGTHVEQAGPLELTEDGIIRMPIMFGEGVGREPSSSSHPPKIRNGWVTCDATAQGGPKFFEPVPPNEVEALRQKPAPPPPPPAEAQRQSNPNDPDDEDPSGPVPPSASSWDESRYWKVVNLEDDELLPIVKRPEPFAPGTGRVPPSDTLVRNLRNGDKVEQIGHSKKVRGYMVMPVVIEGDEGWVVRRLVDKSREQPHSAWFQELNGGRNERRENRRSKNRQRED